MIILMLGISIDSFAQNRRGRGFAQSNGNQDYGYCLTNIEMTAEQKAKVTELQKTHQTEMAVLREKVQSTRDWSAKGPARQEMDVLRTKHQEEIWAIVPEAKTQANTMRQGRPYRQGQNGRSWGGGGRRGGRGL